MRGAQHGEPQYFYQEHQKALVQEALLKLPQGASLPRQSEVLESLAKKLCYLRNFERSDLGLIHTIVSKKGYREAAVLPATDVGFGVLHALPSGMICSGGTDGVVRVWRESADRGWEMEALRGHEEEVSYVHAVSETEVISASADRTIRIWNRREDGQWKSEMIPRSAGPARCLLPLPDGRIALGNYRGSSPATGEVESVMSTSSPRSLHMR